MCNLAMDVQQSVRDVINGMTDLGEMFSAFDVTRTVRKIDGIGYVKHIGGIREFVHELFTNNELPISYSRSNIVHSQFGQVAIFHPVTVDPNTYDTDADTETDDEDTDDTDTDDDSDVDGTKVDQRGRLCISKKTLNGAYIFDGDNVAVGSVLGELVITKNGLGKRVISARDHGFRIPRRQLRKSLPVSDVFKVEISGMSIIVTVP